MDIRIPIGLMFSIFGILITFFGLFTIDSGIYNKSLGLNVNIIMGILMLLFGSVMLWLARRKKKTN